MKKRFKRMGRICLRLVLIVMLLLLVCFIYHKVQLAKEDELYQPIGVQVEVNNLTMSVYAEGEGKDTLVFLSGGGTCSPILDFKTLYSRLSDTYRIAVVEKLGYGFSEITEDTSKDIDSILEESREALRLAGVKGPYILSPHSMSGIEAVYWAQKYPEEVKAIIGLDMAVPEIYEDYPIPMNMLKLTSFAAEIGLTRWIPGVSERDAIKYGTLSEKEKELYRVIFYRRTVTADMLREFKSVKSNAQFVSEREMPDIPMLLFVSNGEDTGWDEEKWKSYPKEFISQLSEGQLIELDCAHYIHNIEYERIEVEIRQYLKEICD
ncbi:alpha/beta fold hydrolase [Natranaerovirga hydrolytica]